MDEQFEYTDEPCVEGCGAKAGEPCAPDCWVRAENEGTKTYEGEDD